MKIVLKWTFLFFLPTFAFCQTQGEMNRQASNDFKKADSALSEIYHHILSGYSSDTVFIRNLKAAQQIWIQFRDSELKLKYPDRPQGYYGSVLPMCQSIYLTDLTNDRIKVLQVWIEGIVEGDVCAGSVKKKN